MILVIALFLIVMSNKVKNTPKITASTSGLILLLCLGLNSSLTTIVTMNDSDKLKLIDMMEITALINSLNSIFHSSSNIIRYEISIIKHFTKKVKHSAQFLWLDFQIAFAYNIKYE